MRLAYALLAAASMHAADFVLVTSGRLGDVRIEDYEIAVTPMTNSEYKLFVDATGHAAPLHWINGAIPPGMEQHPVIFVNRYDVSAYVDWRSRKEGRIYRVPSTAEYEFAARAGLPNAVYPWGSEAPNGKANYDAAGQRTFAQWREFLKPVKSYQPNPLGLYDMAGNVWQMVDSYPDEAVARFKYRITRPAELENGLAGGSWARSDYYLKVNVRGGASPGIRHPDIGFRVVREPAGSAHFKRQARRVVAQNAGAGTVYVGWQLLAQDRADTAFHVYRATRRTSAGQRITGEPVRGGTNFIDRSPDVKGRIYYRVRPVDAAGKEGPPSEWAAAEAGGPASGLIAVFEPTGKNTGAVPMFGDLNGDGVLDAVLRLDNNIREMSRDPGVPVELEAFTSYGRSIWRRPLVWHNKAFGSANNVPVAVYDMDGDGRSEVICRLQDGDEVYLAILDGMTGDVRRKTPWAKMATDFSKSSTRIHLSIAYLNGKTPGVVTQTGLYENEIFDAYDSELKKLWTFESFAETNGSGSHHIDIADVDGDGRDEVFNGTTLLNPDGTLRWSIYREHPDIVAIKHILPGSKDRQVYYAVESSVHAGAYVVDARTGKIIWKVNREDDPRWNHAHIGWASDILEDSPGMEMLTNRDGHLAKDTVLFSANGKILANPFPHGWRPVNWTGGKARDLMSGNGKRIGKFDGKEVVEPGMRAPNEAASGGCNMVADLAGDFRDEVVCSAEGKIMVFTNIEPADRREVTRTASREYRLWLARNQGAGYGSYFEWEPGY
jgi:rhamnogalacturonan endolyase